MLTFSESSPTETENLGVDIDKLKEDILKILETDETETPSTTPRYGIRKSLGNQNWNFWFWVLNLCLKNSMTLMITCSQNYYYFRADNYNDFDFGDYQQYYENYDEFAPQYVEQQDDRLDQEQQQNQNYQSYWFLYLCLSFIKHFFNMLST